MNKLKKIANNPKLPILYFLNSKLSRFLSDKLFLKIDYYTYMGKRLNLKNPKTFNEKLQWLKIWDRNPRYIDLVDKYEVRKEISHLIGEEYLIPLIDVYDDYRQIKFDELPNEFVLKPNHTSGNVYICRDKSQIDYVALEKEIQQWMKREYFWIHREWPYKSVRPRIICEKLMIDDSGSELKDYKFLCFNGKVKCLFVGLNRDSEQGLNVDFYDLDWNLLPFERHYPNSDSSIPKPKNLEKMVELAEILSKNIPFVRVDFYEVEGNIYFGELTFYPGGGLEEFSPESYDYLLGSWINVI